MTVMDLTTQYMGFSLKNPLVASASPLTASITSIQRLEQAGIGAVVLASLFEPLQQQKNHTLNTLPTHEIEASTPFMDSYEFSAVPETYLAFVKEARQAVNIPIIASLNGCSEQGWVDYALQLQDAGADALELHINLIPALDATGTDIEQAYLKIVRSVKATVQIPVAIKVPPYFSSFGHMAKQFDQLGVDGLVLFNRLLQPDFNLNRMQVEPRWPLSKPSDMSVPLHWTAMLHGQLNASIAATTGVHDHEAIIKYLLAGADVVMLASCLMQNGTDFLPPLLKGVQNWMERREFTSLAGLRGAMSQSAAYSDTEVERKRYIEMLDGQRFQPVLAD